MEASNLCLFNKYGFCKYGNKCKKKHVNLVCENEKCENVTCEKRHPKTCHFYTQYGRCKFMNYCQYKHIKPRNIFDEIDELKKEMAVFDRWVSSIKGWMEKEVLEINSDVDDLENTVDGLETEQFVVQSALDEVFKAVITLKKQMKNIFPSWCIECGFDVKEEKEHKKHRKKHSKENLRT